MRRLYVVPHDVVTQHQQTFHPKVGWHYIDLINYISPLHGDLKHDDPAAWFALPAVEEWVRQGKPVLLSTSHEHSEGAENRWHAHPEVAILPHPVFEGTDTLFKHADNPKSKKKIKGKHMMALSTIGIHAMDTVWSVHDKAQLIHPEVRLRAVL